MLKHLEVHRPLAFVDVETTGLDPLHDRIVELACRLVTPSSDVRSLDFRFDPTVPIPRSATSIHGIRDEHVAGCPCFKDVAKRLLHFIGDADLAGFGIVRFDLPFLVNEFERSGFTFSLRGRKVVDALTLFRRHEPRDLAAAMRHFCNRDHAKAHSAAHDVDATIAVLDAMLGTFKDAPRSAAELHDYLIDVDVEGWFRREGADVLFARGRYRGRLLTDVALEDSAYLSWLEERSLPDAKRLIKKALGDRV